MRVENLQEPQFLKNKQYNTKIFPSSLFSQNQQKQHQKQHGGVGGIVVPNYLKNWSTNS